jgi:hypothetical protein
MAERIMSLAEIKAVVAHAQRLDFDQHVLGDVCFDLLNHSFREQKKFAFGSCKVVKETEKELTLQGIFSDLFPWQNINAEAILFDVSAPSAAGERQCALRITIPEGYTAVSYLSQYGSGLDGGVDSAELSTTPQLGDYFQEISFDKQEIVFCSVDYTTGESEKVFRPSAFGTWLPSYKLGCGINFAANVSFVDSLGEYLMEVSGKRVDESRNGLGTFQSRSRACSRSDCRNSG